MRLSRCLPALAAALLAVPTPAWAQGLPATTAGYLRMMDADGDGRIALAEYLAHMSHGFAAMDLDGDQVLDARELPAGPRSHPPLTLARHHANLEATFRRQDANGDGYLDARELAAPPR